MAELCVLGRCEIPGAHAVKTTVSVSTQPIVRPAVNSFPPALFRASRS